jgi:hypothetical protein
MEVILEIGTMILGLLLRIGIPALITIGLILFFTRLDARWKTEMITSTTRPMAKNTGCWKIHGCSEEKRANCPAWKDPNTPCWQVHRSGSGPLLDQCLNCKVFREAPIPV